MPEHDEPALQSKRHPLVVAEQVSKAHVCPEGQAQAEPEQTLEPQLETSRDKSAIENKEPKRMMENLTDPNGEKMRRRRCDDLRRSGRAKTG